MTDATSSPRKGVRLAAAGALTVVLLASAAVLGTTSYAGNSNQNASSSQYDEKVLVCHVGDDGPVTLRVSPSGAKGHLKSHRADHAGPCA